jgi:hypothetical protein
MVYGAEPPYEILRNKLIDFATMQRLRRFARYWDLAGNSGNFIDTVPLLWRENGSAFAGFMKWSDWLHARVGRRHGIALAALAELLFEYLTVEMALPRSGVAESLWCDWRRAGRREKPEFLAPYIGEAEAGVPRPAAAGLKRQRRHLGAAAR